MDCIVFEYPLIQVEKDSNANKLAPSLAKEEDDILDCGQQNGDGLHTFNDQPETSSKSSDFGDSWEHEQLEFELDDIGLSIEECNAGQKADRKLATLRQQVKNLSARLDKQQRCAELRERRLRTLYEEELESIETDYQKSIMYFLRQHREQNLQPSESHVSQATQVELENLADPLAGKEMTEKACNTMPQENCENCMKKEKTEVDELASKTQQLYIKLDKLALRVASCSADVGRITAEDNNDVKITPLTKTGSLMTAKSVNKKNKSRRYRKRQKMCGSPKKEPKSKTLSTQSKIVAQAAIDEQKKKRERKEPEEPVDGLVRTTHGDTFLVPGYSPAPSDAEDDEGWQTVRPRRFKTSTCKVSARANTSPNDGLKTRFHTFHHFSSKPGKATNAEDKRRSPRK